MKALKVVSFPLLCVSYILYDIYILYIFIIYECLWRLAHFLIVYLLNKNITRLLGHIVHTMCPGSSDPFYIVSYYMKWVTTSWAHSIFCHHKKRQKWQKHVNELLHFFRSLLRCWPWAEQNNKEFLFVGAHAGA